MNSKVVSPPGSLPQGSAVPAQERTFTSGPWCVEAPFGGGATDEGDLSIVQAGLQTYEWQFIAHLPYGPPSEGAVPLAQVKANARLIAAAPDMLAVLESALAAWPQLDTDEEINGADLVEWFCTHFAPSARAAIAKTEGGAS